MERCLFFLARLAQRDQLLGLAPCVEEAEDVGDPLLQPGKLLPEEGEEGDRRREQREHEARRDELLASRAREAAPRVGVVVA